MKMKMDESWPRGRAETCSNNFQTSTRTKRTGRTDSTEQARPGRLKPAEINLPSPGSVYSYLQNFWNYHDHEYRFSKLE